MNGPSIQLCPSITRNHAYALVDWLRDDEVRQYLTESQDVSADIERILSTVVLPDLSCFFNQNGRFFMITTDDHEPVGFVRLAAKNNETEIVITIGDKNNWGKGLGPCAIRKSMETAFFEMRSEKVIAKIHKDNQRAKRAFENAGFSLEDNASAFHTFSISMDRYLEIIRTHSAAATVSDNASLEDNDTELYLSENDWQKLKQITDYEWHVPEPFEPYIEELEAEINKAFVIEPEQLPDNVVSMNSKALVEYDGAEIEVALVYPEEADWSASKLSVLTPLGTAIIGSREGDVIKKELQSGYAEIQIKEILYQPEAAGDYHL